MLLQARNSVSSSGDVDVSTDGGVSWVTKSAPIDPVYGYARPIDFYISDGVAILAAGNGVYNASFVSFDNGNTWPTRIAAVGYGGGGVVGWNAGFGIDNLFVLALSGSPNNTGGVLLATVAGIGDHAPGYWPDGNCTSGMIFSTDHGVSWQNSDFSLGESIVGTIDFDGLQFIGNAVFGGGSSTITMYSLDGSHWVPTPYTSDMVPFWSNKIGCTEAA